jgi:short-subunit dehydrogenase
VRYHCGFLLANGGHDLGKGFLDQDFNDVRHLIDTNITGTLYLLQKIGRDMRSRGAVVSCLIYGIDRRLHALNVSSGLQRMAFPIPSPSHSERP